MVQGREYFGGNSSLLQFIKLAPAYAGGKHGIEGGRRYASKSARRKSVFPFMIQVVHPRKRLHD
jgi:hypothetical protein